MTITCGALHPPIVYVTCKVHPVESLLEFVNCLLYSEVTSRRRAVCEFENFLLGVLRYNRTKLEFGSVVDWVTNSEHAVFH